MALQASHFLDFRTVTTQWVLLTGTDYNVPSVEDSAQLKLFTHAYANVQTLPTLKKALPFIQVNFSCRFVPVIGQCDFSHAAMRHPMAPQYPESCNPANSTSEIASKTKMRFRAPYTLPCLHTVCGEFLCGTGVCPVGDCGTHIRNMEHHFNYVADKYLEFKLAENTKICLNCDVPRARIYCPDCEAFLCSKCDTLIHEQNPFFYEHKRLDSRKPFMLLRAKVHDCTKHNKPFVKYDILGEIGSKAMCEDCYALKSQDIAVKISTALSKTNAKHAVPAAQAAENNDHSHDSAQFMTPLGETPNDDEDDANLIVRDYEAYRLALIKHIGRRVDSLQKITARQLQVIEAGIVAADADIRLNAASIQERLVERRTIFPRAIKIHEEEIKSKLALMIRRQEPSFTAQAVHYTKILDELTQQETMLTYLLGPMVNSNPSSIAESPTSNTPTTPQLNAMITPHGTETNPNIAALLEDNEQLSAIRDALQHSLRQTFLSWPYSTGGNINLTFSRNKFFLRSIGSISDYWENDKFRGAASVLHFNPNLERMVQLSRVIMSADLPYFFAIRAVSHEVANADGEDSHTSDAPYPRISAIGVSRYGVLPDREITDDINKIHTWMFSSKPDPVKKGSYEWRFDHAEEYYNVRLQNYELVPRVCGQFEDDCKAPEDFKGRNFDMIGCYVDRRVGIIKLISAAPSTDASNSPTSYYVSQNTCAIEADDGFFPTIAVADGTENNGVIDIGVARFVTGFEQAIDIFRELYA